MARGRASGSPASPDTGGPPPGTSLEPLPGAHPCSRRRNCWHRPGFRVTQIMLILRSGPWVLVLKNEKWGEALTLLIKLPTV